jgi:hypothetical protein
MLWRHALILLILAATTKVQAQTHGWGFVGTQPYRGQVRDVLAAAKAGSTIPLTAVTIPASKGKSSYATTIVGGNPFSKSLGISTVTVVVVPVIVTIGATVFDPTAPDSCIPSGVSALAAFEASPLLNDVAFDGGPGPQHAATMNGVDVGTTTYNDAVRRAEFWSHVGGSNYHLAFNVQIASSFTITAADVKDMGGGVVLTTQCAALGVLPLTQFEGFLSQVVLPQYYNPMTFVYFLMTDVVASGATPLSCVSGCQIGYHGAAGSPVQTFAISEYDTTAGFWYQPGIRDISVSAHEWGEWLDDPLGTNVAPAWGNIGQQSGCQTNWEVGDPLTGTDFPAITMANGVTYNPQELAFVSWFYAGKTDPSIGAGGMFSANGTFSGPAKGCPPGGTYAN